MLLLLSGLTPVWRHAPGQPVLYVYSTPLAHRLSFALRVSLATCPGSIRCICLLYLRSRPSFAPPVTFSPATCPGSGRVWGQAYDYSTPVLSLDTILPPPILYGVWHTKGESVKGLTLHNSRAIVLH